MLLLWLGRGGGILFGLVLLLKPSIDLSQPGRQLAAFHNPLWAHHGVYHFFEKKKSTVSVTQACSYSPVHGLLATTHIERVLGT